MGLCPSVPWGQQGCYWWAGPAARKLEMERRAETKGSTLSESRAPLRVSLLMETFGNKVCGCALLSLHQQLFSVLILFKYS